MSDGTTSNELKFENEEDEDELIDISQFDKVSSYNVTYTVETLINKIENDEICLKPEFQRNFVWDIKTASGFIDSLLIELPTPTIFLGIRKNDEKFIVIDGQQRLKSLYQYIKKEDFFKDNAHKQFKLTFKQEPGYKQPQWAGLTFSTLNKVLQRRLNNAQINVTVVQYSDVTPDLVFELFNRLNSKGVKLLPQEIRNCVYAGDFNNLLTRLNRDINWRKLVGPVEDSRFQDIELILRFFALYYDVKVYKPSMKSFLSDFIRKNRNLEHFGDTELTSLFKATMETIADQIGEEAFRRESVKLNRSLFDAVAVGVARGITSQKLNKDLRKHYSQFLKKYFSSASAMEGTTERAKVQDRIELAEQLFTHE